jgi:hypothetical protein
MHWVLKWTLKAYAHTLDLKLSTPSQQLSTNLLTVQMSVYATDAQNYKICYYLTCILAIGRDQWMAMKIRCFSTWFKWIHRIMS